MRGRDDDRLSFAQEHGGEDISEEEQYRKRYEGIDRSQYDTVAHPAAYAVELFGPHMLSAPGGHGDAECVEGAAEEHAHPLGRRYGCHGIGPQSVHGCLQYDGSDRGYRILKSHRDTHGEQQ